MKIKKKFGKIMKYSGGAGSNLNKYIEIKVIMKQNLL